MSHIRGMMAATLDGYVADPSGGVGFLDPFQDVDWGWPDFIAGIGTVVMGRKTYDHIWDLTPEWPYPGVPGIVLGHPAAPLRGPVTAMADLDALIDRLRAPSGRDVWIVGGPALQTTLLARGCLDRLQVCIVPRLLGRGLRLFPETGDPLPEPVLHDARSLPRGMVLLDYRFGARGGRER